MSAAHHMRCRLIHFDIQPINLITAISLLLYYKKLERSFRHCYYCYWMLVSQFLVHHLRKRGSLHHYVSRKKMQHHTIEQIEPVIIKSYHRRPLLLLQHVNIILVYIYILNISNDMCQIYSSPSLDIMSKKKRERWLYT